MNSKASETEDEVSVSLAPLLNVRGGAKAVDFYKAAFDAKEVYRVDDEMGAVVARLAIAGAEFWLADESPADQNFSPTTLGGSTARLVLTVPDPDAAVAKALAVGATLVWPVADQYGWRIGCVVDPFGHHWEIGQPLAGGT